MDAGGRRQGLYLLAVGSHSSRLSDNSSRQPALPAGWGWPVARQPNANPYCLREGRDFTPSATSAVRLFFLKMSNSLVFLNVSVTPEAICAAVQFYLQRRQRRPVLLTLELIPSSN